MITCQRKKQRVLSADIIEDHLEEQKKSPATRVGGARTQGISNNSGSVSAQCGHSMTRTAGMAYMVGGGRKRGECKVGFLGYGVPNHVAG